MEKKKSKRNALLRDVFYNGSYFIKRISAFFGFKSFTKNMRGAEIFFSS
jgi:hypothetical protein